MDLPISKQTLDDLATQDVALAMPGAIDQTPRGDGKSMLRRYNANYPFNPVDTLPKGAWGVRFNGNAEVSIPIPQGAFKVRLIAYGAVFGCIDGNVPDVATMTVNTLQQGLFLIPPGEGCQFACYGSQEIRVRGVAGSYVSATFATQLEVGLGDTKV